MARINKADHAIILRKVEVEECKISDVAAEYGCSAANLYALLRKLRRAGVQPAASEPEDEAAAAAPVLAVTPGEKSAVDLFASRSTRAAAFAGAAAGGADCEAGPAGASAGVPLKT